MQKQETRLDISPRKQRKHDFMTNRNSEINKIRVVKSGLSKQDLT
jgi:hypothetical protein